MKYYSIPQVAEKLNVSRIAIYKQVKSGNINALKIGRTYAIRSDEVPGISLRGRKRDSLKKKGLSAMQEEKHALGAAAGKMTPGQRLVAYYNHNFLVNKVYESGIKRRGRVKL